MTGDEVGFFCANYLHEMELVSFDAQERAYLDDPKVLGRVVDPATSPFFAYHVGASIARVVRALVKGRSQPHLVELGCGSGSVALLLALGGARVVGIDRNPVAVSACWRRQALYEAQFGPLPLEFRVADAVTFRYEPCDGVYSVFAFNLMRPTPDLLDRLVPALAPGGRFVLADSNGQSMVSRWLRRHRGPSPGELQSALAARGMTVSEPHFGGLIPPPLARVALTRLLAETIEQRVPSNLLGRTAASYTLIAEKQQLRVSTRRVEPSRQRTRRRPAARHPGAPQRSPDRVRERRGRNASWRIRRSRLLALSAGLGASAAISLAAACAADICLVGFCC